ncbi:3-dehydroquinate synthase [Weeksella virosa]|uniref:3-dehydroquinate synthase n=1 Tax=Weeksella virosa TaxID=1014 RepID=UPI000DFF8F00|nr:3-dehydroquinate synthase [Weeksella virosa]SUP53411.1 3-dehydroquinate synthase [Weeksella virosa]
MKNASIIFRSPLLKIQNYFSQNPTKNCFVLVDENTRIHCLKQLRLTLPDLHLKIIEIPSGEENKSLKTTNLVWSFLSENKADRQSVLINLGGGVLTDLGGFAASTYKRGIPFINIPTTLLAMVDASAGGKNGIDFQGFKNQIGTFTQPEMVIILPKFLKTLDQRQLYSGLAEMLKHGLIADEDHWKKLISLTEHNAKTLKGLIEDSINIKLKIVKEDPYEKGLRKILNFGHTFGHAIESEFLSTDKPLLHGEAIVIGMILESILSWQLGILHEQDLETILAGFASIYGKPQNIDFCLHPAILQWLQHDKKNKGHQLQFSLIEKIGKANYNQTCTESQVLDALEEYNKRFG